MRSRRLGVTVWGNRGSIPAFSPDTMIYGGNTTCFELKYGGKEPILVDAGTGIYHFSETLLAQKRQQPIGRIHILLSHLHWDHIQGLPMCGFLYREDAEIHFYSHHADVFKHLSIQHKSPYFPVPWKALPAKIVAHHIGCGDDLKINDVKVSTVGLKHPGGALGFKFKQDKKTLSVLTDNEWDLMSKPMKTKVTQFLRDTQLLLHDGMFIGHEIPTYDGWGHTYLNHLVQIPWVKEAKAANRRKLAIIHHHPNRSDTQLAWLEKLIQKELDSVKFIMAKESSTYWC